MRLLKTFALAAACALAATAAHAVTFGFTPGNNTPGSGYAPTAGYVVIDRFDTLADLAPFSGSGFGLYGPTSTPDGADPAFPTGDGTTFLSVLAGGSASANFVSPFAGSFQFDWGSVDTYNTFTLHMLSAPDIVVNPGSFSLADGNQFNAGTNGVFTVTTTGLEQITGFTLASSANSFEIDNFSVTGGRNPLTGGAVPEPATWAFMIMGFGGAGAMLRRRRALARVAVA